MPLTKPEQVSRSAYDWHDIQVYIETKHGFDMRDVKGKFGGSEEYQDYWNYLCGVYGFHNGSYVYFSQEMMSDAKPWQQAITDLILEEFGEEIEIWIEW